MIDEVVLMRHGRTHYNLARRMQGQIDIPLDIVGQWQVDESGYALAKRYYWAKIGNIARDSEAQTVDQNLAPALRRNLMEYEKAPASQREMTVVCSDLWRTQQTAHAFADLLGLKVTPDKRLRERSFGEWEGMTREEIQERWPEDYALWQSHEGGELKHDVESRQALGKRGSDTINAYVDHYMDDSIPRTLFVVSHGSWISSTLETLLGIDVDEFNNLTGMRNAFWSVVKPVQTDEGRKWTLMEFNHGPEIASYVDWENGPSMLRNPEMPDWKPLKGPRG